MNWAACLAETGDRKEGVAMKVVGLQGVVEEVVSLEEAGDWMEGAAMKAMDWRVWHALTAAVDWKAMEVEKAGLAVKLVGFVETEAQEEAVLMAEGKTGNQKCTGKSARMIQEHGTTL